VGGDIVIGGVTILRFPEDFACSIIIIDTSNDSEDHQNELCCRNLFNFRFFSRNFISSYGTIGTPIDLSTINNIPIITQRFGINIGSLCSGNVVIKEC